MLAQNELVSTSALIAVSPWAASCLPIATAAVVREPVDLEGTPAEPGRGLAPAEGPSWTWGKQGINLYLHASQISGVYEINQIYYLPT